MDRLFLIIDPQNDFADPKGSLYVPGAEGAIENICKFIDAKYIDDILISQDTHQKFNIGFPDFWDIELKPFDKIKVDDIRNGIVKPKYLRPAWDKAFEKQFESYRDPELTIWPYHCLEGSWGWCFPDSLVSALNDWNVGNPKHRKYEIYQKGNVPEIESYSILTDYSFSGYVRKVEDRIMPPRILDKNYDQVFVAGFCKDICVAHSLRSLRRSSYLKARLVILDNCMATLDQNSPNLEIYDDLVKNFGAKIENV